MSRETQRANEYVFLKQYFAAQMQTLTNAILQRQLHTSKQNKT